MWVCFNPTDSLLPASAPLQALALFAESRCAPILEASLKRDPNATVRAQALASLGGFLQVPELLDRLVLAMGDPADEVRLQAAHTLNGLNPDDVKPHREQLVELLETENDELQEAVCQLLSSCYKRDWRTLADRLMGAEKTGSLRGLIRTLSLIGDPKIGVLFLPILDHREAEIRELAAEQLSHVASRLSVESLVRYLEDPNERVRSAIVRCLGKQLGAEAMAPLMERMLDPSALVRQEVAAAFGRATELEDEEPVQVLTKMAKDASVLVRAQALASLIRLGVTGQRKVFEEACQDLDEADLVALRARLNKDGTLYHVLEIMKTDRGARKRADACVFSRPGGPGSIRSRHRSCAAGSGHHGSHGRDRSAGPARGPGHPGGDRSAEQRPRGGGAESRQAPTTAFVVAA